MKGEWEICQTERTRLSPIPQRTTSIPLPPSPYPFTAFLPTMCQEPAKSLYAVTWWNLANGCRVPSIALVAVWTLNKDGAITQAFSKDLSPNVV